MSASPEDGAPAEAASSAAASTAGVADAVPVGPVSAGSGAPPASRSRVALVASGLLIAVLSLGVGIAIGRATAPSSGDAAVVAPSEPGSAAAASGAASSSPSPGASGAASPSASSFLDGLPSDGALLGSKNAKVQLTYWADFQCPFCAKFAQEALPALASRIADGTVSVLHRDYAFLGPESLDAAISVRCGGEQGRYWQMHDAVYAAQAGENKGAFSTDNLKTIAASAGLDASQFAACLDRHDVLVAVLADMAAGARSGVKSTPTIDLQGQRLRGVPLSTELIKAIDAAAASGASRSAAPTAAPSVTPSGDPWSTTATDGRTAGPATAPATVELWVDYQSSDMPALVKDLEPELRKRAQAGKVQLVLRDLAVLGDESVTAAAFDRCVAQAGGSAWFTSDVLGVSAQGADAGIFTPRNLLWFAARIGDDVAAIDACMADPATVAAIKADTAAGTGLGLKSGPAVIVKVGDRETARFTGSLNAAKVLAAVDKAK